MRDHLREARERERVERLRGVVIEALHRGEPRVRFAVGSVAEIEPPREIRHRPAPVRPDEADVGEARGDVVREHALERERRVGRERDAHRPAIGQQVVHRLRAERMRVGDRAPAIEFLHDRREERIAEILVALILPRIRIAAHEGDAVRLQRVEGVLHLLERAIDVGEREDGKQPEAPLVFLHQLNAVLVAVARQRPRLRIVAEVDARLADRQHRHLDAVAVHVLDGLHVAPLDDRRLPGAHRPEHVAIHRGGVVIVDVDDAASRRRRRQSRLLSAQHVRRKRGCTCRGKARQKGATADRCGHGWQTIHNETIRRHSL